MGCVISHGVISAFLMSKSMVRCQDMGLWFVVNRVVLERDFSPSYPFSHVNCHCMIIMYRPGKDSGLFGSRSSLGSCV